MIKIGWLTLPPQKQPKSGRGIAKQQVQKRRKEGIQMYLGFNKNYCFFPYKNRNIYLNLCQSSEHLQDTLLTKLLGQFIGLHNI